MWNWLYASQRPSETIASRRGSLLTRIPQRPFFTGYAARLTAPMPPARGPSADPALIMSEANITACRPDPQTLLIVTAPTRSGRPPKIAAWRAGFWPRPAEITLPMRTSSMSAGTSPARFTASATTVLPSLTASTLRKARPYLPTGVRQAPARTTSVKSRPRPIDQRGGAIKTLPDGSGTTPSYGGRLPRTGSRGRRVPSAPDRGIHRARPGGRTDTPSHTRNGRSG